MSRAVIAVVDSLRAELYTLERYGDAPDQLVERQVIERDGHASFARLIMASVRELVDDRHANRVVICAAPPVLDDLRACMPGLIDPMTAVAELPRVLTGMSPGELAGELA